MALSKLNKNIRRFAELHAQVKRDQKELEALKEFFKAEAATKPCAFLDGKAGLQIDVVDIEKTAIDTEKVRHDYGTAYDKTRTETHVTLKHISDEKENAA